MAKMPHPDNWSVLILCTGNGNELLRGVAHKAISDLGFDVNVYDIPGYPVDAGVHSHAACVEAISSHDIVVAFADESEGGEFQISQAPAAMVNDLRDKGILPVEGSSHPIPTIFQVEVLTAKSLGKPTIVFIPNDIEASVAQTIKLLRSNHIKLEAHSDRSIDPLPLIERSAWDELLTSFVVPSGHISSFRQIVFLERLRKESPNFVSFYDPKKPDELNEEIRSRLSGVIEVIIREHVEQVNARIETKRDPVGTSSLQDLINNRLIISSPFEILSGTMNSPLFSTDEYVGEVAKSLVAGKDVLLLGHPGLGKTTASLLSFRDLAKETRRWVEGYTPLYTSWRTLPANLFTEDMSEDFGDKFRRVILGLPLNRGPWPSALPLPRKKWLLVLDGLDESSLEPSTLIAVLNALTANSTLFATCRQHNFERQLQGCKQCFHHVVQLLPWDNEDIEKYLNALRDSGKELAYNFISERLRSGRLPDFISIPLWLSMLTYLAEREIKQGSKIASLEATEYDLFRECADAVANDEFNRNHVTDKTVDELKKLWSRVAWELHKTRREGRALTIKELEQLRIQEDTPFGKAFFALLDVHGFRVAGFFHEVFQEYWLAEFLVDRLVDESTTHEAIAEYFSYQRSVVTNRFIKQRIKSIEDVEKISVRLQGAFRAADEIGDKALFAKNQLTYLLGRIDEGENNKKFLRSLWRASDELPFVKHSVAFAAIMLGDAEIEDEYYSLLNTSKSDDEMNRGYHLYYYGDMINAKENAMPVVDNNNEAEATLRQLFKRLHRTELRHLRLRRIELLTIRRFLETGRTLPKDVQNPSDTIKRVIEGLKSHNMEIEYIQGVGIEAEKVLKLLSEERVPAAEREEWREPETKPDFSSEDHIVTKEEQSPIARQNQSHKPSERQHEAKKMTPSAQEVSVDKREPLIDFAIITAIEVERLAVCKAFGLTDKNRAPKEGRQYWRGRLSLANGEFYEIVVAQLPDMANVDAALSANDMIHHWKPSALLMVGIAAAATEEQLLGDAIVGSDIYYYERGKVTPKGTKPEFKMFKADPVLWGLVTTLPNWRARGLPPRPDGQQKRPKIHSGVIASGEKVIADEKIRDSIAVQHRKIIAIEMEGYGVSAAAWQSFNQVRCLVIRGICDLADSTKNSIWHPYAAAVAAGLAKHLLRARPLEPRNAAYQTDNPETNKVEAAVNGSEASKVIDPPSAPAPRADHRIDASLGRRRGLSIPRSLLSSLRSTLLECDEFGSDAQLVAVFSSAELKPWRAGLPSAPNAAARADLVVGYLVNKFRTDGENALILLLRELSDRYDPSDERNGRLLGLIDELERISHD